MPRCSLVDGPAGVNETAIPPRSNGEPPDGVQRHSCSCKAPVAGAAEAGNRALRHTRLKTIEDFRKARFRAFTRKTASPRVSVKTDGWPPRPGPAGPGAGAQRLSPMRRDTHLSRPVRIVSVD
jgi:hypothetical protein